MYSTTLGRLSITVLAGLFFYAFVFTQPAAACPFCTAVEQTLSEEIAAADVCVIAKLCKEKKLDNVATASEADLARQGVSKSDFEIVSVVKGHEFLKPGMIFKTVFFGEAKPGSQFLVMGLEPPVVIWSTPYELSDQSSEYVKKIVTLPKAGPERIAFFLDYLEHNNDVLKQDAYEEFARAPYEDIKAIKDKLDHDQIIAWIQSREIPASRKRLYFTMLGICDQPGDAKLLEELMQSDDRLLKAGLDAMIACYMTLTGSDGMDLIDRLFISNNQAEYSDTYSAISAIRFHGDETMTIPRDRLLKSLRLMLDRPRLADLVIPDLARWEDWSVMDQLVKLHKEATDQTKWVRVPVINYLRICPLPESKTHLEELKQLDPSAYKRALTFFPFLGEEEEEEEEEEASQEDASKKAAQAPSVKSIESQPTEKTAEPGESTAKPDSAAIKTNCSISESANQSANSNVDVYVSKVHVPSENRVTALRPPTSGTDADAIALPQSSIDDRKSKQASMIDSPPIAEVALHQTLLIVLIPALISAATFLLLWLVISGKVDRISL
jgi:hypothetical protein